MLKLKVDPERHPSLWIAMHPDAPLRDGVVAFRAERARNGGRVLHPRDRAPAAIQELSQLVQVDE